MQDHPARGVEADVGHAHRALLLAAGEALEAGLELPAEIVVAILGDEVQKLDGAFLEPVRGVD